jgi:hypothetical protein
MSKAIDKVKKLTAEYFGIDVEELSCKERTRVKTIPRNMAIYILYDKFGFKPAELYTHFKKDRSCMYHSIDVMKIDITSVKHIRDDYETLSKIIEQKFLVKKINRMQEEFNEREKLKENEPDPIATLDQELNIECALMIN